MIIYKYGKNYIKLLIIVDSIFFLYFASTFLTNNSESPIKFLVLMSALYLLYYIVIIISSVYTITKATLTYNTFFRRIDFVWEDIYSIESRAPALKVIEKHSIAIYSRNHKKEIPVTSCVGNYEKLLTIIIEKSKNNSEIRIDKEVENLF